MTSCRLGLQQLLLAFVLVAFAAQTEARRPLTFECRPEHVDLMNKCTTTLIQARFKYEDKLLMKVSASVQLVQDAVKLHPELSFLTDALEKVSAYVEGNIYPRLACFELFKAKNPDVHSDCLLGPTMNTCLLFHGVGGDGPGKMADADKAGELAHFQARGGDFGRTHEFLSNTRLCDSIFYSTDTKFRGWDDDSLQREYCKAIEKVQPDMVFTHSAGNLILAAGIARGLPGCDQIGRAATQVNWYGSQGPLKGAPVEFIHGVCSDCVKYLWSTKGASSLAAHSLTTAAVCTVMKPIAISRYCTKEKGHLLGFFDNYQLYPSLDALRTTHVNERKGYAAGEKFTPQLSCATNETKAKGVPPCKTLWDVANELMSGEMCGYNTMSTSAGAWSAAARGEAIGFVLSLMSNLLGSGWGDGDELIAPPNTGNDGMVPAHSCKIYPVKDKFTTKPYTPYYTFAGNHYDGACGAGTGDDPAEPMRQPCSWFEWCAGHTKALVLSQLDGVCGDEMHCETKFGVYYKKLKDVMPKKALDAFSAEVNRTIDNSHMGFERGYQHESEEQTWNEFFAAIDDNRDLIISPNEFYFWDTMAQNDAEYHKLSEKVVFAAFDVNADQRLTHEEFRGFFTKNKVSLSVVQGLSSQLRLFHEGIIRFVVKAGSAPPTAKMARLIRAGRWMAVRDLWRSYFAAKLASVDMGQFKLDLGLSDWDVDTIALYEKDVTDYLIPDIGRYDLMRENDKPIEIIIRDWFDTMDTNVDGFLSLEEVQAWMKDCANYCMDPATGKNIFDSPVTLMSDKGWDVNNDGKVDFDEFFSRLSANFRAMPPALIATATVNSRVRGRSRHDALEYIKKSSSTVPDQILDMIKQGKWNDAFNAYGAALFGKYVVTTPAKGANPVYKRVGMIPPTAGQLYKTLLPTLSPNTLQFATSFVLELRAVFSGETDAKALKEQEESAKEEVQLAKREVAKNEMSFGSSDFAELSEGSASLSFDSTAVNSESSSPTNKGGPAPPTPTEITTMGKKLAQVVADATSNGEESSSKPTTEVLTAKLVELCTTANRLFNEEVMGQILAAAVPELNVEPFTPAQVHEIYENVKKEVGTKVPNDPASPSSGSSGSSQQ